MFIVYDKLTDCHHQQINMLYRDLSLSLPAQRQEGYSIQNGKLELSSSRGILADGPTDTPPETPREVDRVRRKSDV